MQILTLVSITSLLLLLAIILTARTKIAERLVLGILIGSVAVLPRTLYVPEGGVEGHVGIASSSPTLMTYHVAVAVALAFYILRKPGKFRLPALFIVFMVGLILSVLILWRNSPMQWSGVWHFSIAIMCWPLGFFLVNSLREDENNQLFMCNLVIVIFGFQLALATLQILGVSLPVEISGGSGSTFSGLERVSGSLGNPANLSKVSYFLMLLLLPLLAATPSRRIRRLTIPTILLTVLIGTLTISRANVAATLATIVIWTAFAPSRTSIARRIIALTGVAGVFLATGLPTVQRQMADPEGSFRPELNQIALGQLSHTFWEGVGVNSFVDEVGKTSPLVAMGFPVHNSFLLLLVELGPILSLLFLAPLISLVSRALKDYADPASRNPASFATLAAMPGISVILLTGYGAIGTYLLPLLMLVCGSCERWLLKSPQEATDDRIAVRRSIK